MARKKSTATQAKEFFLRNAGSSYDPKTETKAQGQRRGASQLADAERIAAELGWHVEWVQDEDPDLSWADAEQLEEIKEVLVALLKDQDGNVLGSLGGITFGKNHTENQKQGRVFEAELALEAASEKGLL